MLEEKERQEAAKKEAQWRLFPSLESASQGVLRPSADPGLDWCKYLWSAWSLNPKMNGRETYRKCGDDEKMERILVDCSSLKISTMGGVYFTSKNDYWKVRYNDLWSAPRLPGSSGEREMVAALCDNIIQEGSK
jgi:hypothetical protein